MLFLRKVSQPHLSEYAFNADGELAEKNSKSHPTPEISIVHVEGELFFGSTDIFLDQTRLICQSPNLKVIILRIRNVHHLDATAALAIADLIRFANENNRHLIISGANEQVEAVLRHSKVIDLLGEENFFRHIPHNPNLSTKYALQRAQEILGKESANIVLFAPSHEKKEEKNKEEPTIASTP